MNKQELENFYSEKGYLAEKERVESEGFTLHYNSYKEFLEYERCFVRDQEEREFIDKKLEEFEN